jgi:hypothetical protein
LAGSGNRSVFVARQQHGRLSTIYVEQMKTQQLRDGAFRSTRQDLNSIRRRKQEAITQRQRREFRFSIIDPSGRQ